MVGVGWDEGASAATIAKAREELKDYTGVYEQLAPSSGAYLNEVSALPIAPASDALTSFSKASLYEADFQWTFFGSHYKKLRQIKAKWDPKSLFVVAKGVGSEDWDDALNCRL